MRKKLPFIRFASRSFLSGKNIALYGVDGQPTVAQVETVGGKILARESIDPSCELATEYLTVRALDREIRGMETTGRTSGRA